MFYLDHCCSDPALPEHPLDFIEEIIEQGLGILEFIGPSHVVFRAMPVVACLRPLFEPRADGSNSMGVVEPTNRVPSGAWRVNE